MGKSRIEKEMEYNEKYSMIPRDYFQRLSWLYDELKITDKKSEEMLAVRDQMLRSLRYSSFQIILYEEPEGAKRPRFRLINRKNIANMALSNPDFVHVYSPDAMQDNVHMRRLITQEDFIPLNSLIATPCNIVIDTFSKTPSYFNKTDKVLSEIGLIRPVSKPDWDNIGKKYSDMFNANIWLDDIFVVDGSIHKYYSVLPRVEINIHYMNMMYNKQMHDRITSRADYMSEIDLKYFKMEE